MLRLILFGLFVMEAAGVIYRLPQREYNKMPVMTMMDPYVPCMVDSGAAYCYVQAKLIGNVSNPIYNLTLEYSASKIAHYDHTHLHRGICLKQSCSQFMNISSNYTGVVEACLNDSLTRDYDMTSRVYDIRCERYPVTVEYTTGDYLFGALLLALIGLNILGTLYDLQCGHGKDTLAGKFFLCFSLRENWRILAGPSSPSAMQRRIRVIYCFRTITAFLVVLGHSPLTAFLLGNNPLYVEEMYYNPFYLLLFNGTLVVQTFFLMSGFLLAYNNLLAEEKKRASWQNFHTAVVHRWFRLTPAYAFVLFYVMTWARHDEGPYQMAVVLPEVDDCYKDWWYHLIYIYNYEDNSQCMAHAWYLSADFQLTIVGLVIFSFIYNNRIRKIVIGVVAIAGLLMIGVHTYIQNLHAVLVVTPEVGMNFFVTDPTFNNVYKRGHTNLICYALGLGSAYLIYNLKDTDIGTEKYKKYRIFYWLLPVIMLSCAWLGALFYIEYIKIPIAVSVVHSGAIKLIFGSLNVAFLFFTIVKVDSAYRGFLNWPGWTRISRLTYFAYLVHVPVLRFTASSSTDVQVHMSLFWFMCNFITVLVISFLLAVPLFVMVESPLAEAIKVLMAPPRKPKDKEKQVATIIYKADPSEQTLLEATGEWRASKLTQ